MKFTVSKKEDAIKDSGGGGLINRSAIYDCVINYVQIAETKNKAYQLNFNVSSGGMDQTIYGPILVNKDGNINTITQNLLNRLCIIAGMDEGQEIETETADIAVGKDKKVMEMEIIPELSDLAVKMRVQMEYSLWDNNIQERKAIKAFYREDGATAAEANSGENIGKRLALDEEKYATNVTYKDGLTAEDVTTWISSKASGAKTPSSTGAAPKTTAKRPLFGKPA
jgi:hypothetical protein